MDPTGGVVSYVVNKLGDLLISEIALLDNTRQDLEWVQSELPMMQAVLEHVAAMKIQDARITVWIDEVRKLAFHAEDVVDTFSRRVGIAASKSLLPRFIFRTKSKHDFGTEITQLRERVAELKRQKETYDIRIPDTSSAAGNVDRTDELHQFRRLRAAPYAEDRDVVGLDGHVKAVIELLGREGSRRSVVSIVGMGGLGKTTLARKVYNNILRSSSSFDCTAWVVVSPKYNILDLMKEIAKDIMNFSSEDVGKMNQGTLIEKLCKFIQFQKYLIVLDDVWTSELWELLDDLLPDPNNGSRIITTTRNIEVAKSANPLLSPYLLSTLGDVESRVLFTKKVFPYEENPEQCCTEELASLRERIVKQCDGLPLAIIVVGGLLSRKEKTPKEWSEVADKIDWYHIEKGERCMGILALSYIDLPVHLIWCFLYLALVVKDCKVFARRLLRLWIAEGFVKEKEGGSLEETAAIYLEELVQRCLIRVLERTPYGSVEVCCVHDLLRDFAISEAKRIGFLHVWDYDSDPSSVVLLRRLAFTTDRILGTTYLPLKTSQLRTLLIMDRKDWERGEDTYLVVDKIAGYIEWSSIHKNLKLLRVLELGVYIHHLPDEIEHMVNLRYLSLSSYGLNKLPESLGNLRYLQTLDLGTTHVNCLPVSIWRIHTLRYLRGGWETRLPEPETCLPTNSFQDLRTLRHVLARPWMETILPNLKCLEELEICRDRDGSIPDYLCKTIKSLERLSVLILPERKFSYGGKTIMELCKIFSPSKSHIYLHTLELSDLVVESSEIEELPRKINQVKLAQARINHNVIKLLGELPSLHLLGLSEVSIVKEEMIFESGWFPLLHVLRLDNLNIKSWELVPRCLPVLRDLEIRRCSRLQVLPESLWHISTLKSLTLRCVSSQLQEKLTGEDRHKVQHIECVSIYP